MDSTPGLEIEVAAYNEFFGRWNQGVFEKQRLGQAFYHYFRLHRLTDQTSLFGLYEADGEKALVTSSEDFWICFLLPNIADGFFRRISRSKTAVY